MSEELEHSDRRVNCDEATRVSNASYHLAVVATDTLLDSQLSVQSSLMEHGRLFPTPFGRLTVSGQTRGRGRQNGEIEG